jgi:hypothetical protein
MRMGGLRAGTTWRLALLAGAAVIAGPAYGANIFWNGGTGDWDTAANWNPASVPGAADIAFVNNGGTAQASGQVTAQQLRIGEADGAGVTASGTVDVSGNLTTFDSFVGRLANGNGTTATGVLTVGGALTGLASVGVVFPSAGPTPSSASGTVTVQTGDLTVSASGFFVVGQVLAPDATASGTVTVETGALRTVGSAFGLVWGIGSANGGSAVGSVQAPSVDTSAQALTNLFIGTASGGGTAVGTLALGSGVLDVGGSVQVGAASADSGGTATGVLALGGTVQGTGANRSLGVGVATGTNPFGLGEGHTAGTIEAEGVSGFRFVQIGTTAVHQSLDVEATGTALIGAGGIVNATDPGGSLAVGLSNGVAVNGIVAGPGGVARGTATVAGDITGYGLVDIGRVVNTGTAEGTLDLTNGTLTTTRLRIGTVDGSGGLTLDGAVATDARGRLSVTDGAIVITEFAPGILGLTEIGTIETPDPIPNSARGELALTRSSFSGGVLWVGLGGEGMLTATSGSEVEVNSLTVGASGGSGTIGLASSTLAVRADPDFAGTGSMTVGNSGGTGLVTATDSTIAVDTFLFIGAGPQLGRMALTDSTLSVGVFAGIGAFDPGSRGELSLINSTATVGSVLRLGTSANQGELFGEAILEVRSSLLTIGGDLLMDVFGAPGIETIFGIDGLTRGLGGYGAIDAETATLAGLVTVDFAGLGAPPGVGDWVFDLIVTGTGIFRDFDAVQFLGLADGYYVSFHGIVEQSEGAIWRVILAEANAVPEPAALALLLFGLAGLAMARQTAAFRQIGNGLLTRS